LLIIKTLFICSANVWRSQMAEWYYNYFTNSNNAASAALIEARRKKYDNKPADSIVNIMREDWIDISSQKVKLLTKEICDDSDIIILLLTPNWEQDSGFTINWEKPTKFILKNYSNKIQIRAVKDPFLETNDKLRDIRDEIKSFVYNSLK